MKVKMPVGEIVCTLIILLSFFMPWGQLSEYGPLVTKSAESSGLKILRFDISGWNSNWVPLNITIPNYLLILVACGVALVAFFRKNRKAAIPGFVNILLAAYGSLHSVMFFLEIVPQGNIGIGILLCIGSFIVLLILSIMALTGKKPGVDSAAN